MRRAFVGGNHKMHGTRASVEALVRGLRDVGEAVEVVVAPPMPYLLPAAAAAAGSPLRVAAQNCHEEVQGAFTGETSAAQARDAGAAWAIVGHSERRHVFGETDARLAAKTAAVQQAGLGAILCVGETLAEREAGRTAEVVLGQLAALAEAVTSWSSVVVAYEPVWAIGTGRTASPAQAQSVHRDIRDWLAKKIGTQADSVRIIYGGSVNPGNCEALAAEPDIDGFLVGGASLKLDQFKTIIQAKVARANL